MHNITQKIKGVFQQNTLRGGFFLIVATMCANVLNFIFNAYLGRVLEPIDYGTITVLNTIIYLSTILIGGVAGTVNRETAYLTAKHGGGASITFFAYTKKYSMYTSFVLTLAWIAYIPFTAHFFNIDSVLLLVYCSPFIFAGIISGIYRGFLQGHFMFSTIAILIGTEALLKLVLAGIFVQVNLGEWVALSIPLSITLAFFGSWFYGEKKRNLLDKEKTQEIPFSFPRKFYFASVITGLSSAVFLSIDIILVKHYFDPIIAGQYALLSLIGKMIFFLGSLLNTFIITLVSTDEGKSKNPHLNFYKIFFGTFILTLGAYICVGPLGWFTIPLLLGSKTIPILPYITQYALATAIFTLANAIVLFHLARKQYIFPLISLCMSGVYALGIILFHDSINAVLHVFISASIINLSTIFILHCAYAFGQRIAHNLRDAFYIFAPIPHTPKKNPDGKNILIFNWRDKENKFAGGAEIYIHEIAERWVARGHSVTLFCSNDSHQTPNAESNGMNIVRRGGFFGVYVFAFIYYIFKFRGKYDVIVDCENGIPFFTPLYAKEKVYILIHHVHQDVFYKYLPKPLAMFAATLEKNVMPIVYRNTKFITISESSKQDIIKLNLTTNTIQIVNPGINPKSLSPGEKSDTPVIFSIGRLKAYKSIDILIRAFKIVSEKIPEARLVIAGSGDVRAELELLTRKLGLENTVKFLGKIPEEDKVLWFQKSWVFVNPSMMEGWGITSIEANACGTAVVASDVPGLRDSVQNTHTGFLAEYGNPEAFAEKIVMLCTNDRVRIEMQNNAIEWAKNFDWDTLSEEFINKINT